MATQFTFVRRTVLAALCLMAFAQASFADEASIRKNIAERLPDFPKSTK